MFGVGGQTLGIGAEASYATPVSPTRLLEAEIDDFVREQELYTRSVEAVDVQGHILGRQKSVLYGAMGSIQLPVYLNGLGIVLRSAFPAAPSGRPGWELRGSGLYRGKYVTDAGTTRPSYTITMRRARRDGSLRSFPYYGMVCTRAEISVNDRDPVMARFDYVGEGELGRELADTGAYPPAGTWYHHDDTELFLDGTSVFARSFTLKCDFGMDPNIRYLTGELAGVRERDRPVRSKIPEFYGFIDLHYDQADDTLYRKWVNAEPFSLLLRCEQAGQRFQIDIPACLIRQIDVISSPRYLTTAQIEFRGFYAPPADLMTVTYLTAGPTE